ncbi:MAG: tRNA (adenosine(37)-N6)-threonylcarbamoyltransferase complex transferase subunit TsaD [Candidatus Moranbacteria bacterium]|nr:tRNA (adenosine(37)-N6)-threonylcarbamoyltransferase complex transferase subunit TsaD [Candidatus Moranbacteria bacterium]
MRILSVETSCDDTAVALVNVSRNRFSVIDSLVSSQTKVHAPFGGVVPNLAAREHLKNLPVMLRGFLKKNKISSGNIDLIAVTQGPGLIPALLIGTNAAKALAYAWKKPLVGVHHISGHIYANFIDRLSLTSDVGEIRFPVLALIVSGGHTELILMKKHLDYKIVGQTLDDAAGEAFDKVAKMLGLGYPGGPIVSAIADKFRKSFKVRPFPFPTIHREIPQGQTFQLPRPMINSKNLDFSFSGLKTAVLYTIRDNPKILKSVKLKSALCYDFQQAVIDVLVHKTVQAAKKYKPKTILLGGGVSANKELRKQLGEAIKRLLPNSQYQLPAAGYSLDNAAMIAVAGHYQYKLAKNKNKFDNNWKNLEADANLKLV